MRRRSYTSLQQEYELRSFLSALDARRISTADFKSALMILRQHCADGGVLREWADSVAHQKRNRGIAFVAGKALWFETFQMNAFFRTENPRLNRIPVPIFERMLALFKDPKFRIHGLDMKSNFPGGHSREEFAPSVEWMYRKNEKEGVYTFVSPSHKNKDDLELMRHLLTQLRNSDWGGPPFHLRFVCRELADAFNRLIKTGKRTLQKNEDLLSLHFLCAFHLTEVELAFYPPGPKTTCLLSVDSTRSGHLCLSLGLYTRKDGEWDAIELPESNRSARFSGSHCYTRPFIVTDLKEADYYWTGTGSETSFCSAVKVVKKANGTWLLRPDNN